MAHSTAASSSSIIAYLVSVLVHHRELASTSFYTSLWRCKRAYPIPFFSESIHLERCVEFRVEMSQYLRRR
jgi:hypothetical protein